MVRGPLEARVQHPLALTLLGPKPRRAAPTGEGRLRLGLQSAYSSIYEENTDGRDEVVFDGEYLHTSLSARLGIGERTDLELTLGGLYGTSGFLDAFVDSFHGSLGLPDGGRDQAPRDEYLMRIRDEGETLYELEEDTVGLLDVPIWIVHALVLEAEGRPGVAVRAGVELPAGDQERGFGNGALDWGAGVLLEKTTGRFTWTGGVDVILTGDPDAFERTGTELEEIVQVALGGEARLTARTSLLVQLLWYSPLVTDIALEEIDREIFDLGIGFASDLTRDLRFFASFHEDVVAAAGSDFTLLMGVHWTP